MSNSSHEPKIRETTLDDLVSLRTMKAEAWRITYPNEEKGVSKSWVYDRVADWLTADGLDNARERLRDKINNPDVLHLVGIIGNVVVGFICVSRKASIQKVEALYINKDYYGTGLAQRLMKRALLWLDRSKPIMLDVVSYNQRAMKYYEKFGFKVQKGSEYILNDKLPVVKMIRQGDKSEI